ncbi:hypothetical protein MUK42_21895 [Musa troglodytarum]|uniref:Transmembrane protein n=1 Tax=Musa troglodytarum TaxID=320322 RepID=A0A9E7G7N8_9LILI|nr:hypothetical protein MUK42_21895 [Musa troglodytarum]
MIIRPLIPHPGNHEGSARAGQGRARRFRHRLIAMGGAGGGGHEMHPGGVEDFRTKVWSMTGGPYCRPKHWKRNTAIAMFGIFLVCIPIAIKSAELEQRPHHPVRPIPSQLWCKNFGKKEY